MLPAKADKYFKLYNTFGNSLNITSSCFERTLFSSEFNLKSFKINGVYRTVIMAISY